MRVVFLAATFAGILGASTIATAQISNEHSTKTGALTKLSPEEKAKQIYSEFLASQLPDPAEGVSYYTGECVALDGSTDPKALDWGLLGLARTGDAIQTSWWVAYTDDVKGTGSNSWADMSLETLIKYYPVQGLPPVIDEGHWRVTVTETVTPDAPKLFYQIGEDKTSHTIYVVGVHAGYLYCRMHPL